MIDSKKTMSLESVSTSGTNDSAFFCEGIDSHEMKYSMSDDDSETTGLVNSLSRSTEELIGSTRKSDLSFASSHSDYNYNVPGNVNTIFRHQTGPSLRFENSEISIANPVGGSSSSQSNTPIPTAPQSIGGKNEDEHVVTSTTRKPWFSLGKTGSSVSIPLNDSNHESTKISTSTTRAPSFSYTNPRIEKEASKEEQEQHGISNVSDDRLFGPRNNSLDHFTFHRSREGTSATETTRTTKLTKEEKKLMHIIQNHFISVSNISNSLSSQTEDTTPVQFSTEESHTLTSYLGSIFSSFHDKMKEQKDKTVEHYNSLRTIINAFSSYMASCCSTNISSAIAANRKCTQQIPSITKVPGNSSSADDFLIIEQMTKDVGIEISELYNFLKQHYLDYPVCSDNIQIRDDPIYLISMDNFQECTSSESNDNSSSSTDNLDNRSSMSETKNFSLNKFIREIDACAEKVGLSRTEFLHKVTSMITNKSAVTNKVDTEDMKKASNHLNDLRLAGALVTEDESVLLKYDAAELSNYKIHPSKSIKGHTRTSIGLGKQVGLEKKKKSTRFVQKGRFRWIT